MKKLPEWTSPMVQMVCARKDVLNPFPYDFFDDSNIKIACNQNDYLQLSEHPEVIAAKNKATNETGSGVLASLFAYNGHGHHKMFNQKIAESAKCSSADCVLMTTSGWAANIGLMEAIVGPNVPVYIDALAHASLFDGIRLSPGKMIPFRHNNPKVAEKFIEMYGPGVIVVDAFYSTYGSVAPLKEFVDLAEKYDCILVVDEAHSFAVVGEKGGGLAVEQNLADKVHIRTVSLAKGVGGAGGVILADEETTYYLAHRLRPVIFSSYPSPSTSAGNLKSLEIIQREPERARNVMQRAVQLRKLLNENNIDTGPSQCQIVSLLLNTETDVCRLWGALRDEGILFCVFLYPAVAKDKGLARFSMHTNLTKKDIEFVAEKTIKSMHNLGIESHFPPKMRVYE
jgi:CAI-1 autoinducer synthase